MAQINDFLSHIDLEAMREYCMANGETVRYAKGDCIAETGRICRYVGFVKSGYFKYCVVTSKGDYAVTGFSLVDDCIMDVTQSFLLNKPSKIIIRAGCDSEVLQVPLKSLRDFITKIKPGLITQIASVCLEEAYTATFVFTQSLQPSVTLNLLRNIPMSWSKSHSAILPLIYSLRLLISVVSVKNWANKSRA